VSKSKPGRISTLFSVELYNYIVAYASVRNISHEKAVSELVEVSMRIGSVYKVIADAQKRAKSAEGEAS
jgi:hypothetical protein